MKIDVTKHTVDEIVEALCEKVKETSPNEATVFELRLTHEGAHRAITTTGAIYLKAHHISMRNLRGEWIK